MSQSAAFDIPAERREPGAAERFVRGRAGMAAVEDQPEDQEPREARVVPLRAVLDVASGVLIASGLAVGVLAAWLAGGQVPGLATLAGALIALGFLLNG